MNSNPNLRVFQKAGVLKLLAAIAILCAFQAGVLAVQPILAIGGAPHTPIVKKITVNGLGGNDTFSFTAYRRNFTGGVRVAVGDVNGDGFADIIAGPGPGMGAHVKVFDGVTGALMRSFQAFPGFFRGGVYVAAGDVNGDGKADIIVGTDAGAPPIVRIFDGATGNVLNSFFAYSPFFTGGVRVAAGDVNGDGRADIITGAGPGAGRPVKVFNGMNFNLLQSFFAYDATFTGGVYVAAGDVNGDTTADIITGAGPGAGPQVKVIDGTSNTILNFFAFDPTFTGGVRVAAGDVNGDGFADIVTGAGPGGGPHVKVFDGHNNLNLLHSFFAYEPNFTGGVFVAAMGGSIEQR